MSHTTDPSLHPDALFGSNAWVARALGLSKDNFFRKRRRLEEDGFPRPDPLTGLYLKDDVIEWVNRRRRLVEAKHVGVQQEINLDAL